ncbi:hypothetical protein H0W26_03135 [Candidatus Dependentiae bacterium]|nr:hypothetical protein [Candidatus Dependentiae bacterium]
MNNRKKLKQAFLLAVVAFNGLSLEGVVTYWSTCKLTTIPKPKELITVADVHNLRSFALLEKEQLEDFIKRLELHASTCNQLLHILIESSEAKNQHKEILTGLIGAVNEKSLKNISIDNAEIRCASAAIIRILGWIKKGGLLGDIPKEARAISGDGRICYLTTVTLQDVIDEYYFITTQLKEKFSLINDTKINEIYEDHLSIIAQQYNEIDKLYFKRMSKEILLKPFVEYLHSTAQYISSSSSLELSEVHYPEEMGDLMYGIRNVSCDLFDLAIFEKMISSDVSRVMVIAGEDHIARVNGLILPLNPEEQMSKGESSRTTKDGCQVVPLQPSKFIFFEKQPEKQAMCILL